VILRALVCLLALLPAGSLLAQPAQLLLIIDDIGYNRALGERALALPAPVNLAFLPHTPFSARLAQQAWQNGHGIMLHAPMENDHGTDLGPGAMLASMDQQTLQTTLKENLSAIPHVQGLNNHTGSLLTQNADAMNWVMEVAREQKLFFIDSLTSPTSVALQQAEALGIPTLARDVFLDNDTNAAALKKQYEHALTLAKRRGYAVLIGHPYAQTLDFLEQELPALAEQNIELQRVDHFFQQRLWSVMTRAQPAPSRYLLNLSQPQVAPR
jgi:polysaccharide deacetylase 2 family uncharacterized protein YibQ